MNVALDFKKYPLNHSSSFCQSIYVWDRQKRFVNAPNDTKITCRSKNKFILSRNSFCFVAKNLGHRHILNTLFFVFRYTFYTMINTNHKSFICHSHHIRVYLNNITHSDKDKNWRFRINTKFSIQFPLKISSFFVHIKLLSIFFNCDIL